MPLVESMRQRRTSLVRARSGQKKPSSSAKGELLSFRFGPPLLVLPKHDVERETWDYLRAGQGEDDKPVKPFKENMTYSSGLVSQSTATERGSWRTQIQTEERKSWLKKFIRNDEAPNLMPRIQ